MVIGLSFAWPTRLVPAWQTGLVNSHWSLEASNVYAVTAWAGWAHFLFAFAGQQQALSRAADAMAGRRLVWFLVVLLACLVVLLLVRLVAGPSLFGAVVWVYFIDHFMKAERKFSGGLTTSLSPWKQWIRSYQLVFSFGWLSVVLFDVGQVNSYRWVLWGVSLAIAAAVLIAGGWHKLVTEESRIPLLALFFIAEALVWGTISPYGGPTFLSGVYVFHIAAGSFFHYLGAYFFARSHSRPAPWWLSPWAIAAVHVAVFAFGYVGANTPGLLVLEAILGVQWFSLWVALHLVASDLFPAIKTWKAA